MTKKLVIVESPAKSKTIEQYLGQDYTVKSSKGHVRDLAIAGAGGLGIDVDNDFRPQYEILPDKKALVKELFDASKKAKEIYLATDPDREGEAISWHLQAVLDTKGKAVKRVIFNEITKTAILEAFEHPREIDDHLVSSQETRRILDRIIGFKLSKLLQSKIKSKSAGRVQSAALKLIVDREKAVEEFKPQEYYEFYARFPGFAAQLYKYKDKTPKIETAQAAQALVDSLERQFLVQSVEIKEKSIESRPPFITSTLQQDASNRFGFSSTKTMSIAQRLYEGITIGAETVGLITYMRTDSVRLSTDFVKKADEWIVREYGKTYLGSQKKTAKGQNVQDAHEAIRPTDVFRTPDSVKSHLSRDEYLLYSMIYARAVASLMKPQILEQKTMLFVSGAALFRAVSTKPLFDGYLRAYGKYETDGQEPKVVLPDWKEGAVQEPSTIEAKQCFTQPPLRYNEARLIKEMEDLGIGRPSTYATTIATLRERKYVAMVEKKFVPSEQGRLTIDELDVFFSEFVSANYSRNMEIVLDQIAMGEGSQLETIRRFWEYFIPLVEYATKTMKKVKPQITGELCPECQSPMVFRQSRYGNFEACSNFPKCRYVKPTPNGKPSAVPARDTGAICPQCHKGHLVERVASKGKNKGNMFFACNNFPKCKYIAPFHTEGEPCPEGRMAIQTGDGKTACIEKTSHETHK